MNALLLLKVTLRTLRRRLLRSLLACLGIIIGVASLIASVTLFNSGIAHGRKTLSLRGERQVVITAAPRGMRLSALRNREVRPQDRLSVDDYVAVRQGGGPLVASTAMVMSLHTLQANGREVTAVLRGTDVEGLAFDHAVPRSIIAGAMFDAADVDAGAGVCVITADLARELFSDDASVGRYVRVNGVPLLVVGVASAKAAWGEPAGRDYEAYLPYSSLLRRIDPGAALRIFVEAPETAAIPELRSHLFGLLEARRGERSAEFVVSDPSEHRLRDAEAAGIARRLLIAVMCISLLVGGIGVMNIMLANVAERTREIGIRLAIGTRTHDILFEFLLEATVLCLLGGAIGIALGAGAAAVVVAQFGWDLQLSLGVIALGFASSVAVGLVFGFAPARAAARLHPLEALRHES
jgi:ABC-type antimicrobial peptide transport system permease subunit